ncbi:FHA domain-containing protein [bacterium]|nr:FHA domain-containing protein [bacterium]
MQVRLKVIGGKNDGREIKISVPKFIIGRGEDAHLRPSSDLVSRNHCAINIGSGKVTVEDMGSRNGTFVNGEQLEAVHLVQVGDTLRVGRLQFELIVDHAQPGAKKPKVENVIEAATRTRNKNHSIEDSITDWLVEDLDAGNASYETTQFNLEETMALSREASEASEDEPLTDEQKSDDSMSDLNDDTVETDPKKKKKKKKGKLPPVPKFSHDDSTNAADHVLRKFFNRR